jgi:hypothetical protein
MELPDYSGSKVVNVTNADALNNSKLQDKHFQEQMNTILARKREEQIKKARSNAKVEKYLNTMPDGIDTSKLPAKYQPGVQDWAKSKQLEFAELAQQAANYESNGDFTNSIAIKSRMTEIENSFKNVDSQLAQFKSYKDNFLEDSQNGMVSNSVNPYKRDLLSSVYTDELDMTFSDDGNITFLNEEGGYVNFNEIPDYTVKNNKGASEILNMNDAVYKSGVMSPSTERLYKMKLQNITKSRDDVLSLATDDFITEGGLGILDDDLLYNEERTDELRNMVIDSYMKMFKETASTSVKASTKKSGTMSQKKHTQTLNNIFSGLQTFKNGEVRDLDAFSKGELALNDEGSYTMWYGDKFVDLDVIDEYTIYKMLELEGVPSDMRPSLDQIRSYLKSQEPQQESQEENKDVNYYYSQID